ncbi:hypothetical protein MXD81_61210 [Microbacteriaceae bacterium K1510]|nr:hypothetical protein [Microbacteriaceae bacterium K1510]
MSKNSNQPWSTKFGPRRVRSEAPTLEEAIFAAQGLSDDLDHQAEIAASLMGLPVDQVRNSPLLKVRPRESFVMPAIAAPSSPAAAPPRTFVVERKFAVERKVVVERKPTRRLITTASR